MSTDGLLDEKAVRKAVKARFKDLFGPSVAFWSNSPGPFGETGRPDFELCATVNGREGVYVGLELKAERFLYAPQGLSDEQAIQLLKIAKAGGIALVGSKLPQQRDSKTWVLECYRMSIIAAFEPCIVVRSGYGAVLQ